MVYFVDRYGLWARKSGWKSAPKPQLGANSTMTGIQFVTDEKGRKVAVQIDLKNHRALWEDIEDVLVSQSRRHEKRILAGSPCNSFSALAVREGR
jgi:hypothetical protein